MGLLTVLSGKTAAVSAPSADTDGVPLWKGMRNIAANEGFTEDLDEASLLMWQTAYTSGVPAVAYARIWGGFAPDPTIASGSGRIIWTPLGTGTGNASASTDKGRLNAGATIEGPSATTFKHTERIRGLREMERIALEIGAFTGVWTLKAVLLAKVVR